MTMTTMNQRDLVIRTLLDAVKAIDTIERGREGRNDDFPDFDRFDRKVLTHLYKIRQTVTKEYFTSVSGIEEDSPLLDRLELESFVDTLHPELVHDNLAVEANNSATGEAGISGCKRKRNDNEVSTLLVVVVAVQFSHWILIMYFISLYLY